MTWLNKTMKARRNPETSMTSDRINGGEFLVFDEMRDVMLLLKRDVDMEAKYPKLKELKDAYEEQLEKYKTFEALK